MDLTPHITRAKATEAARQATALAAVESAARERARQLSRQEEIFRTLIRPTLEECRRQMAANAIDCDLTNGQEPQTGAIRHGLRLTWRGGQHTLTFQANPHGQEIHATALIAGERRDHIRGLDTPLDTLQAVETLVEHFTEISLAWLPRA